MKLALLINDSALRARLTDGMRQPEAAITAYPTAAKALVAFAASAYDVIVMDSKVYPGLGSADPGISELAAMIPATRLNTNLLYWEVAIRVLDVIRADDGPNRATPVLVRLPVLAPSSFDSGDDLTREAVESDLARRTGVEALYAPTAAVLQEAVRRLGPVTASGPRCGNDSDEQTTG